MKQLTCYDCDMLFQAEFRDEMLGKMYDHYMKDHYNVITGASDAEKKAWMEQFERDWMACSL